MSPSGLANLLLADIGKQSSDTLPSGCAEWVLASINGALQEVFSRKKGLFRREYAFATAAPSARDATITGASIVFAGASAGEDLSGCSVRVGQQPTELYDKTATGTYTLPAIPDAQGAQSVTVYTDAFRVDPGSFAAIVGVPYIPGQRDLAVLSSREQLRGARSSGYLADYGERIGGADLITPDVPAACWVDVRQSAFNNQPSILLRIAPVPDAAYVVRADLAVFPRKASAITDTWEFPVDATLHESVVFPLARFRWKASPWWQKPDVDASVKDAYRQALDDLAAHRSDPGGGELVIKY